MCAYTRDRLLIGVAVALTAAASVTEPAALHSGGLERMLQASVTPHLSDEAADVACLYQALGDDIADGTTSAPGFDYAVELSQTIADIEASASGRGPAR